MKNETKRIEIQAALWTLRASFVVAVLAVVFFGVVHCAPRKHMMPTRVPCMVYDLNHDGRVNVQDLQIAVNRHNRALYDSIQRVILSGACDVY